MADPEEKGPHKGSWLRLIVGIVVMVILSLAAWQHCRITIASRLMSLDTDGDGKVSIQEVIGSIKNIFQRKR